MIRPAILAALLGLAACAGHTPPAACRGEMFAMNPPLVGVAPVPAPGPAVRR